MSNVVIPLYVSENGLQDFIDSMVEEIVLNESHSV